jgi:hypothetical protein
MRIEWKTENLVFNEIYWMGNINGSIDKLAMLTYDLFRYHLWNTKLHRTYPMPELIISRTCGTLNTIFSIKPSLKTAFRNNTHLSGVLQAIG